MRVSVKKALETASRSQVINSEITVDRPVFDLVAQSLFEIANAPDPKVRGAMARATKAQRMILNRMVGTRRPGSHPAARQTEELQFADLTVGVLSE